LPLVFCRRRAISIAASDVTTVFSSSDAESIAAALVGRKFGEGWVAHCPAHEDSRPSLSLRERPDGKVLVHCFAGCTQDAVLEALRQCGLWSAEPAAFRGLDRACTAPACWQAPRASLGQFWAE